MGLELSWHDPPLGMAPAPSGAPRSCPQGLRPCPLAAVSACKLHLEPVGTLGRVTAAPVRGVPARPVPPAAAHLVGKLQRHTGVARMGASRPLGGHRPLVPSAELLGAAASGG